MPASVKSTMRPEIADRVARFLTGLQASKHAADVVAVIVAGSACRGEEIWLDGQLLSDIDLMLVTRRTNPRLTRALDSIMNPYRQDGIDGGPTPITTLRRFRTFAFYEARMTGVVVWGNCSVEDLLPAMTPKDLPRWEAIRVLGNRMFEHLKAASGQTTAAQATAKTYEALAEAALALEGRYRPSYMGRLVELTERPPALLTPDTYEAVVTVLRSRLGQRASGIQSVDIARSNLLCAFRDALRAYLQANGTVGELLAMLGHREHHWRHRAYWLMAGQGQATYRYFRTDPIIVLWQRAAAALSVPPDADTARTLLGAWKTCPQILRSQDARYAVEALSNGSLPGRTAA